MNLTIARCRDEAGGLTCDAPEEVPLGAELILESMREPWRVVVVRVVALHRGPELDLSRSAFERIGHLNEAGACVRWRRMGGMAP